jgi:hypothetical protein
MSRVDWSKWSAIAEIGAALAVVITLVYLAKQTQYVAVQTEQNTAALRASVRQDMFQNDLPLLLQLKDVTRESCIFDPARLAASGVGICGSWLLSVFRSRENNWFQYQEGVIDQKTYSSYENALRSVFTLEMLNGTAWWPLLSAQLSPEFVAYVNSRREEWESLRERAAALDSQPAQ